MFHFRTWSATTLEQMKRQSTPYIYIYIDAKRRALRSKACSHTFFPSKLEKPRMLADSRYQGRSLVRKESATQLFTHNVMSLFRVDDCKYNKKSEKASQKSKKERKKAKFR